jgi:hypothetical protein
MKPQISTTRKFLTMNPNKLITVLLLLLAAGVHNAIAEFDSGSTGTVPLVVPAGATVTNDLPPDGVLNYTTITINNSGTLRFRKNALNTPVYLLAKGDVVINGTIDVSGRGTGTNQFVGGEPGPGGFAGGEPGFLVQAGPPPTATAGSGFGPGGGRDILNQRDGFYAVSTAPYGYAHLIPLIGGSGGCGKSNSLAGGGGGGGGAILIASSTRIQINASGKVLANGGPRGDPSAGLGSGGAIRLVAPMVLGTGSLDVSGDSSVGAVAAVRGRIRIDSVLRYDPLDPTNPNSRLNLTNSNALNLDARVWTIGTTMIVFPPTQPRLDIIQVGTNSIPAGTNNLVSITLPPNADTNQLVTVRATDFNTNVLLRVVVTPENGYPTTYDLSIDNTAAGSADVTTPVSLPLNMRAFIHAWTRP